MSFVPCPITQLTKVLILCLGQRQFFPCISFDSHRGLSYLYRAASCVSVNIVFGAASLLDVVHFQTKVRECSMFSDCGTLTIAFA